MCGTWWIGAYSVSRSTGVMLALLAMADLSIRNIDDVTRDRLRVRAAQHGRSMESEVRAILRAAVCEPGDDTNVLLELRRRFADGGGVDLDLPVRAAPPRSPDMSK